MTNLNKNEFINPALLNAQPDTAITNQAAVQKKIQDQSEFSNALLQASINPVFSCVAIRGTNGKITDFQIIKINPAFTEAFEKIPADVEGKTYLHLFPAAEKNGVFDLNCQVAETGVSLRKEIYYKGENLEGWYDTSIVKMGEDGLVITFAVITEEKKAILHLKHQKTLLANVLKFSPSGICVVHIIFDEKGRPTDAVAIIANDAATQITGISKEMLTKKISEIDSKILSNPVFQASLAILKTGKSFLTQYFLKSIGKWLELGISKMDEEHLILVFTDITPSKEVQLNVEKSARQLHSFINASHSGMSYLLPVLDASGQVIEFQFDITNTAFAAYANQNADSIKGEIVSKFYPSYKKNGLFQHYKHTYETHETQRFEVHYLGDGLDAWFDIMSAKTENGVLVTLTDTTPLKKLQIDLETLVNELKKSNENLQEFAYVASHDLQEPLRKIQVFSERLQKNLQDTLNKEDERLFERLIASTQRMSQLIDDLLSYSQLSTKPPAFKTIDLNDIVQHVLNDLEAAVNEKKAIISAGDLPQVNGDVVQLRQLFQNLISNSLKYNKEGTPPVISINSEIIQKEINGVNIPFYQIKIADNGIGFEQQYAERIFKVFQRLHGRSEFPGTGIGLAIVQKVVENHNGSITAESEPEAGAVFKVFLPV